MYNWTVATVRISDLDLTLVKKSKSIHQIKLSLPKSLIVISVIAKSDHLDLGPKGGKMQM